MDITGSVCVVTGGASGIGRALARALATAGARGIVVADLDEQGARAVAEELGSGRAIGTRCDVADEADNAALIAAAEEAFGPVDLFCANAGVGAGSDPMATTPQDWALSWDVNVLAHVHATKHLLPGWLERGEGYFLSTASAAGLLTQIGSAPYAVSKHAAVAFAEWLAVTYGDRGIRVSCLAPMGVRTPMLGLNEDADGPSAEDVVGAAGAIIAPEAVAATVLDALRDERFLVLPHPEVGEFYRRKAADPDRWLSGMRRLQATLSAG